ncbi:Kinase, NEK [Giardia muris]|uniref:non-specific serine/threonine protein kinase n=1 Tax=Giardia muris TaxID=5742 RepID=A0A4Z1T2D4_GIAMU|nr:Kinase, NEK [Giardia muris]|eukprot:TNJ28093.1 Kinase, NEK [Giardia muris]
MLTHIDQPCLNNTYRVIGLCGSGSYGKVYRVEHMVTKKVYACKEICYANMQAKEREILEQEVNVVTTLSHPNVIRHYEIIHDRNSEVLYIIMEYCSNGDLATTKMNAKRVGKHLEESYIINIMRQVLRALEYCHAPFKPSQGTGTATPKLVIHRDVKPENLLIDETGAIKLADFGFCRVMSNTSDMTTTRAGTPLYMAPEVLGGQGYTAKADIWSLGVTFYELCSFRLPYTSPSIDDLRRRIKNETRRPLPSSYSSRLTSVIDLMLELNPTSRPSATMVLEFISYNYDQPGLSMPLGLHTSRSRKPESNGAESLEKSTASVNKPSTVSDGKGPQSGIDDSEKRDFKGSVPKTPKITRSRESASSSVVVKSPPSYKPQGAYASDVDQLRRALEETNAELEAKNREISELTERVQVAEAKYKTVQAELTQLKRCLAGISTPDNQKLSYADLMEVCSQNNREIIRLKSELQIALSRATAAESMAKRAASTTALSKARIPQNINV